ncbi:excalibur calcium-binding domain-containing protein [Sphingopyxis sp.]|uniref:excalibur calcium-binding domain-containing protein n=1 Tax=Sphingopyxis sp. TaxID=1908224 RepID=UPI001D48D1BB|nr:excalibur calcium-binding domain-containing protein [Sphingopyxis sp.]MBW8294756.1 excalibur calcium-binding domain-containing protein [Sphingopyxis sp.]
MLCNCSTRCLRIPKEDETTTNLSRPRRYNHLRRHEHKNSSSSGSVLVALGLIGAATVRGWALASPEQPAAAVSTTKQVAVATGAVRECAPQGGDHWSGCKDARAAGTAQIYRGEPSNREGMDGDGDGIACEP